jgi:predicted O-methyltransferase YrrM
LGAGDALSQTAPESFADVEQRMSRVLDGIPGTLDPAEAAVIYLAAKGAAERANTVSLVEIGCFQGRSALAASIGLRDGGGRGRLYAVDPYSDPAEGEQNLQQFRRNVERAGVSRLIEIVRMPSTSAVDRFVDASVDLLLLAGACEFEVVCMDIVRWTPKLRAGAVVEFNDPFSPGVRRCLLHLVLSGAGPYRHPRWMTNSLLFDYLPGQRYTGRDRLARARAKSLLRLLGPYLNTANNVLSGPDRDRRTGRLVASLNRSAVYPVARQVLPPAG